MFAGNFAPRSWAYCDGQLLAVSQNDALFSLFGTIYGGDGRTTFGLPDLRGRVPVHQGSGPGLTPRKLGQKGGAETVTLSASQIPGHSHALPASSQPATGGNPAGGVPAQSTVSGYLTNPNPLSVRPLANATIASVGGSQSHNNMMPFQCVTFIVCLFGVYPSRN